jgi:DNA ligase (NAD+)
MGNTIGKMKELIQELNTASYAYYTSTPIMSDYDWDKKYEELQMLENQENIIFQNSPTQNVGYTISDKLNEVKLDHLMLSLDKTKSINDLKKFAGNKQCIVSVKCDGLSTTLKYIHGELVSAVTRGNGYEGTDVLQNVLTIKNIPKKIPYDDELIIDGETIIGWDTFNEINSKIKPPDEKYKHPRNLVSGSLLLLDSKEAAQRNMRFIAWRVIKGFEHKSVYADLLNAEKCGFERVPMIPYIGCENTQTVLDTIKDVADANNIPYDGAVMTYDDYAYGESLGKTDKFFRHSIAYKYEDQLYETVLKDIEWNTSKTGLINPVAIFEPIDLDGAITTRATLHNISYIKKLSLGIGDRIRVYRSNKVIPKVHDSIDKSNNFTIPDKCPICGGETKIVKENDSEVLMCINNDCQGKLLGKLVHAVSRNALNIDGLSEATLEKFISLGWLDSIKSIYHLSDYKGKMYGLDGFGKKSVDKLLKSIEKSKETTLDRFVYSLSIPMIGKSASKDVAEFFEYDLIKFLGKTYSVNCLGDVAYKNYKKYCRNHYEEILDLSSEFNFKTQDKSLTNKTNILQDKTFVITGSLEKYSNRDELKSIIESNGGKVSGSVSAKTFALINNDIESSSSKNKKAKSLGVQIINEEQFMQLLN